MKRSRQTGIQKRSDSSEKYNDSSSHSDVSTTRHKEDGLRTNKAIILENKKENKTTVAVMMSDRPFAAYNCNAPTDLRVHLTMTSTTRMEDNREKPGSAAGDCADGKIAVTSGTNGAIDTPTGRVHLTMTSPTRKKDNREEPSSASDNCADGDIAVTSGKKGAAAAEEEQEREKQQKDDDHHQDDDDEDQDDDNSILGGTNRDGKLKRNRVMAKERRTAKEKMNKLMKERIQELTLCNNKLRRKNNEMMRELASLGVDVLIHPSSFQQPDFDGESELKGPGQVPFSVLHIDQPGVEMIGRGSNVDAIAVDPAVFGPRNMVSTRDGLIRLSDNSHPGVQTFISRPPPLMWNQGGINEIRHHSAANGTFPPLYEFGGSSSAASSGHTQVPGYTGAASLVSI